MLHVCYPSSINPLPLIISQQLKVIFSNIKNTKVNTAQAVSCLDEGLQNAQSASYYCPLLDFSSDFLKNYLFIYLYEGVFGHETHCSRIQEKSEQMI